MPKKEHCPTCNQPIMKHRHTFSKALAEILLIAAKSYNVGQPFHLKELDLTSNQYNNFQKLKYWELAAKHFVKGKRIGGYWVLTFKAKRLIQGFIKIPRYITTFNNEFVSQSIEQISMEDAGGQYQIPEQWAKAQSPMELSQKEMEFVDSKPLPNLKEEEERTIRNFRLPPIGIQREVKK